MDDFRRRLSEERRKLLADFLNTIAKLFAGGGLVAPFLQQVSVSAVTVIGAIGAGVVFHVLAHYILFENLENSVDE